MNLKQLLCNLSLSSGRGGSARNNLFLEEVPEIRERLIGETEKSGGFIEIAKQQENIFLCKDKQKISDIAKRLNAAYNTDLLAELEQKVEETEKESAFHHDGDKSNEVKDHKCGNCLAEAEKKCSQCKSIYYCSRYVTLQFTNIRRMS